MRENPDNFQDSVTTAMTEFNFRKRVDLRYFVPQVPISGKMLNGYLMFSVKNIVQNVKLIELLGKNLVPLHFVISKS